MREKKIWDLDECSNRFFRLDALIGTVRRVLEKYDDDVALIDAAYVLREASQLAHKWADRAQSDSVRQESRNP
ncbi:MAG: hypothetical protein NFW16_21005 [Candidatus Accumulibacter sp.]|uniref:hypothetical protein n=1 Tax=Accumulibacter sp. TaxID=2053492 RepID=UPI0025856EBE|nr:hypothetical protein [Accumulibacter sp.]MCM8624145.1 hypothetical protein [Accumulibacter sp.]